MKAKAERPIYAESLHAHDSFGWAPLRSVREGDFKYIEAPKPELYNLREDPGENINIVEKNPAEARRLRGELGKLLARYSAKQPAPLGQHHARNPRAARFARLSRSGPGRETERIGRGSQRPASRNSSFTNGPWCFCMNGA